ncbi:MAG: SwmB domain-containing protein [Chloroflexota bacterium]|nr:SwmB domain-containing protein [Chloroflexota bacterium]MDE2895778.1 SwmB domain-containing protein [Chloroflexota bacterium]
MGLRDHFHRRPEPTKRALLWSGALLALAALLAFAHHPEPLRAQAVAPTVTSVAITSSAGADQTYALGETIRVTVTFGEAVAVSGAPRIAIDMDPADWGQKWAGYEGGSGTNRLTFTHTVVEPNYSTQGIAVLANTLQLNGGSIVSSASQTNAALGHTGLGHDADHKVDWQQSPLAEPNRAPVVDTEARNYAAISGEISAPSEVLVSKPFYQVFSDPDGDKLTYTASVTSGNGHLVELLMIRLPDDPGLAALPPVGVFPRLFLRAGDDAGWKAADPPLADPQIVTVTVTATDPGGLSASVESDFVVNWESHPELVSVVARDQAIVLTYDVALRASPLPSADQFTVHVVAEDGTAGTIKVSGVTLNGVAVTLELASALEPTQTVTLDYRYDAAASLQRAAGGDPAPSFSGQAIAVATPGIPLDQANLEGEQRNSPPSANTPTVTGIAITSDAGSDDLYELGDIIRVSLTFSEAVDVTGLPKLNIDMDPADWGKKFVPYESGSGTTTLVFAHAVAEPNFSSQGIAVLADSLALNGGTIKSTASELDAHLAHAGLNHDGDHRVNWQYPALRPAAPTVTDVEITSDAGSDRSYAIGEDIRVTLRLSEAVNVTGAPRLRLDFRAGDGDEQWASFERGSGSTTLVFAYTVAAGDDSEDGVAVLANSLELNGGAIVAASADAANALLTHTGLARDANHRVDHTPPTLLRAVAEETTLTLTFDEELGAAASLSTDQFAVVRMPQGGSEETIVLTGSPVVSGVSVTMTLATSVPKTGTEVKVSYTRPTTGDGNKLTDLAGNDAESFSDIPAITDATPPRLVSGQIDRDTLTLFFSEALDETSFGGRIRATIRLYRGHKVSFTPSGDLEITGNRVIVGLGNGYVAKAGVTNNVAYYEKDERPGAPVLRDLAGNEVELWPGEVFTRYVTLENITVGPPRVTRVQISSDPGEDDTYGVGDEIRVRVTLNQPVLVLGAPRLKIGFDSGVGARLGDEKWAVYSSGSGSSVLEFSYIVAEAENSLNRSTKGVSVLRNTLRDGTIRSVENGKDADRAFDGLGHDANHKVEIPLRVKSAELSGTTLTIHFSKTLVAAPSLRNGAFVVRNTVAGGGVRTISLVGTPVISGHTLTLKLFRAPSHTESNLNVSYNKPDSGSDNRLVDETGDELASFSEQPIGADVTPPTLIRAEVNANRVTLVFNEPLNPRFSSAHRFRVIMTIRIIHILESHGYEPFAVESTIEFTVRENVEINGNRMSFKTGDGDLYTARPGLDFDSRAYYYKQNDDTAPGLQDLAGNEVTIPHYNPGFWSTRWVHTVNVTQ